MANFLADSGGAFVANSRHGAKAAAELEAAQQAAARRVPAQRGEREGRARRGGVTTTTHRASCA